MRSAYNRKLFDVKHSQLSKNAKNSPLNVLLYMVCYLDQLYNKDYNIIHTPAIISPLVPAWHWSVPKETSTSSYNVFKHFCI